MKKTTGTGLPHGTFKYKDEHPTIAGLLFRSYVKQGDKMYEQWQSLESQESERLKRNGRRRHKSIAKKGRMVAQRTNCPVGTFHAGDKHPWQIGLSFATYESNGTERWQTDSARRKSILANARYRHEKRLRIDPSERKLLNQIYLYRERVQTCTKIRFHVDHTVPISLGGKHTVSNLEVVPAAWNESKSNRHCERWIAR
jgi:hypothetical protein